MVHQTYFLCFWNVRALQNWATLTRTHRRTQDNNSPEWTQDGSSPEWTKESNSPEWTKDGNSPEWTRWPWWPGTAGVSAPADGGEPSTARRGTWSASGIVRSCCVRVQADANRINGIKKYSISKFIFLWLNSYALAIKKWAWRKIYERRKELDWRNSFLPFGLYLHFLIFLLMTLWEGTGWGPWWWPRWTGSFYWHPRALSPEHIDQAAPSRSPGVQLAAAGAASSPPQRGPPAARFLHTQTGNRLNKI